MIKNFLYSFFIHLLIVFGLYFGFSRVNQNIVKSQEVRVAVVFKNQDKIPSVLENPVSIPVAEAKIQPTDSAQKKTNEEIKPQFNSDSKPTVTDLSQEKSQELISKEPQKNHKTVKKKSLPSLSKKQNSKTQNPTLNSMEVELNQRLNSEKPKEKLKEDILKPEKDTNLKELTLSEKKQKTAKEEEKKQNIKESEKLQSQAITQISKVESENILTHNSKNLAEDKSVSAVSEGLDLSAREKLNIQSQIRACYKRAVQESRLDSKIKLFIKINLNKTGFIENDFEEFVDIPRYNDTSQKDYKIAIDNIRRAIELCSPLHNLPVAKYEIWKEVVLQFDPVSSK